jgi:hypothetical protein
LQNIVLLEYILVSKTMIALLKKAMFWSIIVIGL